MSEQPNDTIVSDEGNRENVRDREKRDRESDWRDELTEDQRKYYDMWITSGSAKCEFLEWMSEKKQNENGNYFCGRVWEEHVRSCKARGRDPYD